MLFTSLHLTSHKTDMQNMRQDFLNENCEKLIHLK